MDKKPKKAIPKLGYDELRTRETLIISLKEEDEKAWSVFYDTYAMLILNFAKKRGCSQELAEDVLQETVMSLNRYIKNFRYDRKKGKFKSLLFKITESKVIDAFRRAGKQTKLKHSEEFAVAGGSSGKLSERSLQLWDMEWKEELLARAVESVKERVQEKTFQCFEEVYLKGRSVGETAEKMDFSPNLVSQHKHKVLKLIIETGKEMLEDDNLELE